MNQHFPPSDRPYTFAAAFFHQLLQQLETTGCSEAQFAHNAGFTDKQWQSFKSERLRPALLMLDQLLLANQLVLDFQLAKLKVFGGRLRDFLQQADALGLLETTDQNGNAVFLDESGKRRTIVVEKAEQQEVLIWPEFGQVAIKS